MNPAKDSGNRPSNPVNRTQVARIIFAAAESMGISDREQIEKVTGQVIERLEQQPQHRQPFPGMEDLVPESRRQQRPLPTGAEIEAMVREILTAEKPAEREEVKPEMKTSIVQTEVQPAPGIKLTENALHVLERRYLKKDKKGQVIETVEEMFHRVARAIASAELAYDPKADVKQWEDKFYRVMTSLEFLPNSPTLMNAGRELGQLSACFVLPVEDSMESIFYAVKNTALLHKSGGGTGFSFSRLRQESDRADSTGVVASGPVSFTRFFALATAVTAQVALRPGANMAILSIDNPDIIKFIEAKSDSNALTNYNISVAVTNEFMTAVDAGTDYDLVNQHTKEVYGSLDAS